MLYSDDKKAIIARDKKCLKCGSLYGLTVDHKVPISRGGTDEMSNLQTLCLNCNSNKGSFLELNFVQRIYRLLHADEAIQSLRHETKSLAHSAHSVAQEAKKKVDLLSSKIGAIKVPETSALQAKADQALGLTHLQTNRVTALESRLGLLEKHLKLEYYEGTTLVDKIVQESVPVKEYRKIKV